MRITRDEYFLLSWAAMWSLFTENQNSNPNPIGEHNQMARITSDATSTTIQTAFEPKAFRSHIAEMEKTTSKMTDEGTGGNPMFLFTWEVDEGPYKGRRVPYHYVMLGGKTKEGKDMPIRQLLEVIDGCKIPWATADDKPLVYRPFKKVKTDNGDIIFVDPDTNERIARVDYDDEMFLNRQALVQYGVRKSNDREFNEVVRVLPS